MSVACPACGAALGEVAAGPCRVDLCWCSGGVWFDRDELQRIAREEPRALVSVDRPASVAAQARAPASRHCPRCRVLLAEIPALGGVVADRCPTCGGIWLDGGEVRRVREFPGAPAGAAPPAAGGAAIRTAAPAPDRAVLGDIGAAVAEEAAGWVIWAVIEFVVGRIADVVTA